MKRVIAISLLLAAFVCSLFSDEMNIASTDIGSYVYSFDYQLRLSQRGYLGDYVYCFYIQSDVGRWSFPDFSFWGYSNLDQFTLEVASSDIPTITLRANDTGNDYLSDGKDVIAFLKALLKDGFIVFDVLYQGNTPARLYWYIPRSNDEARIEALEQLEIYEKYLYQWSPLE